MSIIVAGTFLGVEVREGVSERTRQPWRMEDAGVAVGGAKMVSLNLSDQAIADGYPKEGDYVVYEATTNGVFNGQPNWRAVCRRFDLEAGGPVVAKAPAPAPAGATAK